MRMQRPAQKIISLQCLEEESRYDQRAREKHALQESERYMRRRFRESQTNVPDEDDMSESAVRLALKEARGRSRQ